MISIIGTGQTIMDPIRKHLRLMSSVYSMHPCTPNAKIFWEAVQGYEDTDFYLKFAEHDEADTNVYCYD